MRDYVSLPLKIAKDAKILIVFLFTFTLNEILAPCHICPKHPEKDPKSEIYTSMQGDEYPRLFHMSPPYTHNTAKI